MFNIQPIQSGIPNEEFDQLFMNVWAQLAIDNRSRYLELARELDEAGALKYSFNEHLIEIKFLE